MKLNLIVHMLLREKQRIEFMLAKYQTELETLPKGSISKKNVGKKIYYYLKYRDGKKVVSQYISKKDIDGIREQINRRRHTEAMIKSLLAEKAITDKALEGNV